MKVKHYLLAAVIVSFAQACWAEAVPQATTGNANIDAFIANIDAKQRNVAVASISSMESISGEPNAVVTPAEFVEKLLTCSYAGSETRPVYGQNPMYRLTWKCIDGNYSSLLDPAYRAPRITVGEFVSIATLEERKRRPIQTPRPQ